MISEDLRQPHTVGFIPHGRKQNHDAVWTISGLADGIDQQVHLYSLRHGLPTISVLGTGMLQDFPAGSEKLRQEILDRGGLILTEYLPTQTYSAENFIRRNRLQSALSKVVVPIEWKAKSGTAHTLRYAAEHQRLILCLQLPDWTPVGPENPNQLKVLAFDAARLACRAAGCCGHAAHNSAL